MVGRQGPAGYEIIEAFLAVFGAVSRRWPAPGGRVLAARKTYQAPGFEGGRSWTVYSLRVDENF